jgi:arginyl-tRNA synthetase
MKDAHDYIHDMGNEIQKLMSSGNSLEESATSVLTHHIAALEEAIFSTKASGTEKLVRDRKEIEQQLEKYPAVEDDPGHKIRKALEWVFFKREEI